MPSHRTLRSNVIGISADNRLDASQEDLTTEMRSQGRATFTNFYENSQTGTGGKEEPPVVSAASKISVGSCRLEQLSRKTKQIYHNSRPGIKAFFSNFTEKPSISGTRSISRDSAPAAKTAD